MRANHSCPLRHQLIGIILCLFLLAGIDADNSCKKGCPQSDSGLLRYTAGNVYEYTFESIMTVGVKTSESDDTSLKMQGTAKLFAEGNCGYTLQVSAIKVSTTKEAVEKKLVQNIQKPVHFTMVGGKVEPELCADPADTAYALNVKRAIISLLQSNTESTTEVDVFGQCVTHTSVSKGANGEVITKVRNLNNCSYREKINSGLLNGVTNEKAGVKSTMLFQADYSKEVQLGNGIVQSASLVEGYHFAGAAKSGHDVQAKVLTSLKVKNPAGTAGAAPASGTQSTSIIFEKPEVYVAKNLAALKAALSELVQMTNDYVQKDSAKGFVQLIRLMRNADTDTLLELAGVPFPNKVLARKVYLDALFRTGTAESAKATMKQLNKMEEKEKYLAILSLNLVKTVDKETVSQATNLLNQNSPKEVYLAVGNLVSKYCQRHGCEQSDVEAVSKKFSDNLKHCKAQTKKDEDRIVNVLKGIGNTDHLASSAAGALVECASTGKSNRIRVAALQAFSSASCNPAVQKKALELLADRNEDSELRIEAYLAAITCPTAEMANQISDIVNSETVNQVGGFIASSLKAIRDSTDETRENQRYYLSNIRVTKHFPKDFRRYSFNNEVSYKMAPLGLSASADYKLIYSQHGFLPRSARWNVSMELFGTNFNVLESYVRQENIENVLEYYVGPKGLLNKDFDEIISMVGRSASAVTGGRSRRSIADDTAKFAKKYKTYGSKSSQDLNLDVSLKLFGSEMMFLSLGDNVPSKLDDIIRAFSSAVDNFKKDVSTFSKEYMCHTLFMDVQHMYPTGLGVPLEFASQGFSANHLKFAINLDVDAILGNNWQRSEYRLKVEPSVDVSVNVRLGFDAYVLATGLRVESGAHSAGGGDVTFAFTNEGNGFNVDIALPREKIELIHFDLKPDFYIAEKDKAIKSLPLKASGDDSTAEKQQMCYNELMNALGVGFCLTTNGLIGDVTATKVNLLKPVSVSAYLTSERKINLKGTFDQSKPGVQQWKLEYSTPESQVNHNSALTFALGTYPKPFGRLAFENQQLTVALEAGVANDQKEIVLYGQLEKDNSVQRSRIGFTKNGNEYRPVIEIQDKNGVTNNINGISATGRVIVEQAGDNKARYNFDNFQIVREGGDKVGLTGWADVGQKSFDCELRVAPGQQSYFVKSNAKLDSGEVTAGLFVNDDRTPDQVFGGLANVKYADDYWNVKLNCKASTVEVNTDTSVKVSKSADAKSLESFNFDHNSEVKNKGKLLGQVDVHASTVGDNTVNVKAKLAHGTKVAEASYTFKKNQRAQGDFVVEASGKLNKHFVQLTAKCDVNGNLYNVDNVLTTSWGTAITVKGELGQRYTLQDVHINLDGSAQFGGKDKPTQWLLKTMGTPEKTTGDLKVTRDTAELVKVTGELQHPQDKVTTGKVNLVAKNILTAKTEFKMAKNGKGELTVAVETLKTEPKHKIDVSSKFTIQAPKYDVEATVVYDTNKLFYVKTDNVLDRLKFSTKNVVEAANKKVTFDASGSMKGDWRTNGETNGQFVLTSPSGRVLDGSLKRKLSTNAKTGIAQGNMEVQVNDQLANGGAKRSLSVANKVEKLNVKAKEVAANLQIAYTDFEGKKFDFNTNLKHLPKGENKMMNIATTVQGDFFKHTEFTFTVDEYNKDHGVYHVSGKYGDSLSGNVNGQYTVGQQDTPATYDVDITLNAPQTAVKSFTLRSNGKVLKPQKPDGEYVVEISVDEQTGHGKFLKLKTNWKQSGKQGGYGLELESSEMKGPLKVDGTYEHTSSSTKDSENSQKYKFDFSYDTKYIKSTGDVNYIAGDSAQLHYTLDTSFESTKDVDVVVRLQKLESDSYSVNVDAKQAEKVYSLNSKLYRGAYKKGFDIQANMPNHKPMIVVGIFELLGERKGKWSARIENLMDLDFNGNAEASYKAVEDFYVTADWDSTKLNLKNFVLDIRSQGKVITLSLKNADGVVFGGTASYALKVEANKASIEGQGQLQYKGKTQSTNFKLIRQIYDAADNEFGFSYTFNGNFGSKNGVSTLKITNKEYNVKLSVCEEKKQCTNVQLQSIITPEGQDNKQHSLLILIDLRELGYPYEFEFQSKTSRQGFKLQYSLDSKIISNNNMKYQLVANVQPTNSKVQLKLPSRELLLETQQQYPQEGFFGHYENSVQFYFDKVNKPNDVTKASYSADITGVPNRVVNAKGEIKFEHPTIRPLVVGGKFDFNRDQRTVDSELAFDVFRTPEQKIVFVNVLKNVRNEQGFNVTASQVIKSAGFGFHNGWDSFVAFDSERHEFTAGGEAYSIATDSKINVYLLARKDLVEFTLSGMNEPILEFTGAFNRQKYTSKLSTKLHTLGRQTIQIDSELQPTNFKLDVNREGLLKAHAELKLGKELKANVVGAGKELFDGRIALDATNFLQATYKSNDEDVKAFLDTVDAEFKKDTELSKDRIKKKFQKLREVLERQISASKEQLPDFSKLAASYQENVNEIAKDLENDPSLKQLADQYRKLYVKFAKVFGDLTKVLSESYEKLNKSMQGIWHQIEDFLKNTALPLWEEFVLNATNIVGKLRVQLVNLITKSVKSILEVLEKYGPTLKNYGKAVTEALKPFNEAFQELFKVASQATEEVLADLKQYIDGLPNIEVLRDEWKKKLEQLKIVENLIIFTNKFFEQLNILPQTAETMAFLSKAQEYVLNKLNRVQVNDEQVVDELLKLLKSAIRSVLAGMEFSPAGLSAIGMTPEKLKLWMPFATSADVLGQASALLSFRFSVFNFLMNENWESLLTKEYFKSWLFFDDFQLKGHVADGHHLITFDGQYLSFPGSCKYVLAQDSVDNNFTLVAQLNNGKLKTIILADRDGTYVEVNDAGALKLNGNAVEYPQHTSGIHAWRKYYTVWLRSDYGVEVMCLSDLKVCHVIVDGFYTSKTRGLLGNGNAEPFDDFVQLDGTIAPDYATFGNGYGLGKCNPVPLAATTDVPQSDVCNEVFGYESPLALGYLFKNVRPYRDACHSAVANVAEKDKEEAACLIATAYGSALRMDKNIVMLPPRCLKCSGAAGQRELGQEFTTKVPNKLADVVFVVDVNTPAAVLSQLVAPAITDIRESLKGRGFTDVNVGVIAFNESLLYPSLLTSNGGKVNFQGNVAEVELQGPKHFCVTCSSDVDFDPKLLDIYSKVESIIKSIEPQADEKAFKMALEYPFRAGAAKSIIAVRSNSLELGNLFRLFRAYMAEAVTKFDAAMLHLIGPVQDMSLEGVPNEKLIGFNSRLVATVDAKDAKKRPKLKFTNDMGTEFVLNNGGWVFATQNFESLKAGDQKKALNQVTNTIADTMFKTEIVSECRCLPVYGLHAQHKCVIKSSNFVPNKKVKAA